LLDCIAQSGLQSNLVDWIVIDNPKSKPDFGFGLSIQLCHFNPNPKYKNYFIKKLVFHCASCSNNEAKLLFIKIFKQLCNLSVRLQAQVDSRCLLGISWLYYKTLSYNIYYAISFSKNSWIWIGLTIQNYRIEQ